MKRIILILALFLPFVALAQPDDNPEDKVHRYRVAFYTRFLNLSAQEAEVFWPVYNEFLDKRDQMQKDVRPGKGLESMSDQEVEEMLKRHFEFKQRELDLEKETYQKLRQVLPLRKVAKLELAERKFREELVQRLKERQEIRQQRQQGKRRN